jgi:hypothetical protein
MEDSYNAEQVRKLKLELIQSELMSSNTASTGAKTKSKSTIKSQNKAVKKNKENENKKINSNVKKSKSKNKEKTEKSTKTEKTENTENTLRTKKKSKSLKKPAEKKERKKKSKSNEVLDNDTDATSRKWDDSKNRQMLKGQFSPEEEKTITDALCEYVYANKLTKENLIDLITEKQVKGENSIWPKIAECLPNRSVQSIHNFCRRKFNPFNYKGGWSEEEIKNLIHLHSEHGTKWELIAKELGRTATNVKDKFKQIGGKNYKNRSKEFNLILCLKLLKYIQSWLNDDEEEKFFEILKYTYKFKSLPEENNAAYVINESENKMTIDKCLKESSSKIIIRNILKVIVDGDILEKIIELKKEISWNTISSKFGIYSAMDCKNNWDKILREFDLYERSQLRKDLKMIKQ